MIVLTASTLSEDAHETDSLKGSFFTHYLVSGLRGAADENDDRIVTVAEAFQYTHAQTVFATSRTVSGTQHPTFRYDLRGRADLALADLSDVVEHGRLTLPIGATWLIMRIGDSGTMVGEIATDAHRRTLSLRPGEYTVRGRTPDGLLEGTVIVAAGRDVVVDTARLDRTVYARPARKGDSDALVGSGPFAGFAVMTTGSTSDLIPRDLTPAYYGAVANWRWVSRYLTLSPRISVMQRPMYEGTSGYMMTFDVRATHAFVGRGSSLDLGLTIGEGLVRYDFNPGPKPVVHIDATVGLNRSLGDRSNIGAEIAVRWLRHLGDGYVVEAALAVNLIVGFRL